jgi:nucleoside-diphosphate-sugar epimerase
MGNVNAKHSFTYTPDAGKATAMLGNTPSAFDQVWHLPTDNNVPTGKEFIELTANAFGVKPEFMALKKWMVRMAGLFNPVVKESIEMSYQNESDYLFDSSKFAKAFSFLPTPYKAGISETVKSYRH